MINTLYNALLRPLLFNIDAEKAHNLTFSLLKSFPAGLLPAPVELPVEAFGLKFKNPAGLAAGLDKNAVLTDIWPRLGFGFIEIGTLTPKPQAGNPKPRLFRLPQDQALINRMGFNNEGAQAAARRLAKRKSDIIVGGNIGKNKTTPNEEAEQDYIKCINILGDVVDYFVVNISSPNTPNLRALQEKEPLARLLAAVQNANQKRQTPRPVLLKIAPDLTQEALQDIVELVQIHQLDGLIATNTTIDRSQLQTPAAAVEAMGAGGLSGQPLTNKSNNMLQSINQMTNGQLPLIGVGGIASGQQAADRRKAGACLVQVYTGFIYKGPQLAKDICQSWHV